MIDPFWFGVLVTLAVQGALFSFMILAVLAWAVVAIKSHGL